MGAALALLAARALAQEASERAARTEILKYYPDRARSAGVQGTARLGCTRTTHGAMRDCSVISEDPQGYGFGESALKLAALLPENPRLVAPPAAAPAPQPATVEGLCRAEGARLAAP